MPIEVGFVLTTMKTESTARQVAKGRRAHHRCSVEGWTTADGLLTGRGGVDRLQRQGDLDRASFCRRA
ncbi:MAG: hypothetical protein A4E48_01086 [Methanosaeta sp. PtaU1.Bin060]|nr:MAG: hypothetical protein A4E48_01086 [Methanosaeta sp. PtaU1.Bin060]